MKQKTKRILCAILAIVLLAMVIPAGLILGGMNGRGEPDSEYLIVLGTTVNGTEPSPMLKQRLDAALEYLNTHPDTHCIATGGKGDAENLSEAECMYNYLTAAGIDANRITMEDRATSTQELFLHRKRWHRIYILYLWNWLCHQHHREPALHRSAAGYNRCDHPLQRLPPVPGGTHRQRRRLHRLPGARKNRALLPACALVPSGDLRHIWLSPELKIPPTGGIPDCQRTHFYDHDRRGEPCSPAENL